MTWLSEVFERVAPAVIAVRTDDGYGTGFFVDERGLVLTNRHVVGRQGEVILMLHDRSEIPGRVVHAVRSRDLAFILTEEGSAPYPALPIASPRNVKVGQEICIIGHPMDLALHHALTRGAVAGLGRRARGVEWLQFDAAINPGNSGGPLVNQQGEVVGVATWRRTDASGLSFAIPCATIREITDEMRGRFDFLNDARYCSVCGAWNGPAVKRCETCGASIEEHPAPSQRDRPRLPDPPAASPRAWTCVTLKHRGAGSAPRYCPRCGAKTRASS